MKDLRGPPALKKELAKNFGKQVFVKELTRKASQGKTSRTQKIIEQGFVLPRKDHQKKKLSVKENSINFVYDTKIGKNSRNSAGNQDF